MGLGHKTILTTLMESNYWTNFASTIVNYNFNIHFYQQHILHLLYFIFASYFVVGFLSTLCTNYCSRISYGLFSLASSRWLRRPLLVDALLPSAADWRRSFWIRELSTSSSSCSASDELSAADDDIVAECIEFRSRTECSNVNFNAYE